MHITFVIQSGLSRLPSIQRVMRGYSSTHTIRHLTPAALSDLLWWKEILTHPGAFRTIHNLGATVQRGISVDASSVWGIGLRVYDQYKAWRWRPSGIGSKGRDIGWAEAVALELAVRYLHASGIRAESTAAFGDNTSTIAAFDRHRGRNAWTNESVQRAQEMLESMGSELAVTYICSKDNPADVVSRGDFSGLTRLPCTFALPDALVAFLYEV